MFVYLTKSPAVDVVSLGIHCYRYKPSYFPSFQKAMPFMPTGLPQWLSAQHLLPSTSGWKCASQLTLHHHSPRYACAPPSGLSYTTCHAPLGMWAYDPLLSPIWGPSSLPVKTSYFKESLFLFLELVHWSPLAQFS